MKFSLGVHLVQLITDHFPMCFGSVRTVAHHDDLSFLGISVPTKIRNANVLEYPPLVKYMNRHSTPKYNALLFVLSPFSY